MVIASNEAMEQQRQTLRVNEMALQYLMHREREASLLERDRLNREFQSRQLELSHEHQTQLAEFRAKIDFALQDRTLDFQAWSLGQQRDLQLRLNELNAKFQRDLRQFDRETELKKLEEQKKIGQSPIWLVASQILNTQIAPSGYVPLRVLFAPPELQDRPPTSSIPGAFPRISEYLTEELRDLFKIWQQNGRHIEFLDGAWQNRTNFRGAAAAASLFEMLKSEPCLIIDTYVEADRLYLRFAYWGGGTCAKFRFETVLNISWREILDTFAKLRAESWITSRTRWIDSGKDAALFDNGYLADTIKKIRMNLDALQHERFLATEGLPPDPSVYPYHWTSADYEDLKRYLSLWHRVVAGIIADEYFLVDVPSEHRHPPLLPSFLGTLLEHIPQDVREGMAHTLATAYNQMYNYLVEFRESACAPELRLDLARCLAVLPDSSPAMLQWRLAIQAWIRQRKREV